MHLTNGSILTIAIVCCLHIEIEMFKYNVSNAKALANGDVVIKCELLIQYE